jgi:hypothetical protein
MGMLQALANLPEHPENLRINDLLAVEGTPLYSFIFSFLFSYFPIVLRRLFHAHFDKYVYNAE